MVMTTPQIRQLMSRPSTIAEFEAIKDQIIDTLGRPVISADCARCGQRHFTVEPCASEVACPTCGSRAARCQRPSGHDAAQWHAARWAAFDEYCERLERAGRPVVAVWANGESR